VLGSTQAFEVVDAGAAARAGVAVVRRRSGGGAVLLRPGEVVWVDVFVPAGDPLWSPDVGRATHWLGRVWAESLGDLGWAARWHDGPLVTTPWSRLVCFAGLGPGEVRVRGEAKAVGVSQRRTRAGALFQCAALLRWAPGDILDLLALDEARRRLVTDELAGAAVGLGLEVRAVEDAFLARLAAA
jgi:lipoate-protein ligase A